LLDEYRGLITGDAHRSDWPPLATESGRHWRWLPAPLCDQTPALLGDRHSLARRTSPLTSFDRLFSAVLADHRFDPFALSVGALVCQSPPWSVADSLFQSALLRSRNRRSGHRHRFPRFPSAATSPRSGRPCRKWPDRVDSLEIWHCSPR